MKNTIRQRRQKLGWTIRELAQKVGSDISSVSHWENDKKQPRPTKRRKLAEVLGCSVTDLFPELNRESDQDSLPEWFTQAWNSRWVLTLKGWFDISSLRDISNAQEVQDGLVVNDYMIIDRPLDLIIVPIFKVEHAPDLFKWQGEDWVEANEFAEFEKAMAQILDDKEVLRNDLSFWRHEEGISIQPMVGKEKKFNAISQDLMSDLPDYEHRYLDVRI